MAKKKKIPKISKRRLIVFGTASLFIIFYFLFSVGFYSYKIYNLKTEEKTLEKNLENLEKEERNLSSEMDKLKDEDYLAKYARETFSYSKDDEIIIQKFENKTKEQENNSTTFDIDDRYLIGGCSVIMGLIFIFIIKRSIKK